MKKKFCKNPECFDFATGKPARLSADQVKSKAKFCSRSCYGESRRGRGNGKNYIRFNQIEACPECGENPKLFADCLRCKGKGKIRTRPYLHRWKMEQMLGRKLTAAEVVHHIDYDPFNNDESNLQLFPSQSAHYAFHRANPSPPMSPAQLAALQYSDAPEIPF